MSDDKIEAAATAPANPVQAGEKSTGLNEQADKSNGAEKGIRDTDEPAKDSSKNDDRRNGRDRSEQHRGKDRNSARKTHDERHWDDRRRSDRKRDNRSGPYRHGNRRDQGNRPNRANRARKEKEYAKLPISDNPVDIRRQVAFYFSDSNLSNDDFLFKKLVQGSANRPVRLKQIHDFGKMRRYQPYSKVVEALRESEVVDLIDEKGFGNEEIVRKVPIEVPSREGDDDHPPDVDTEFARCKRHHQIVSLDRSVYVKFDSGVEHVEQDDLEDLFRSYGSVMVKRRERDGKWRGSAFVEFGTEDDQKQFLELENKPEYEGKELKVKSKRQYCLEKCAEKGTKPFWEETDERGEPSFKQQNDFESNKKRHNNGPADPTSSDVQADEPAKNGNKRKADADESEHTSSPKKSKKTVELLKDE